MNAVRCAHHANNSLIDMRVSTCDRKGCKRTRCSRHSSEHGYICGDCFTELVHTGPKTDVAQFMDSEKQPQKEEWEARVRYEEVFARVP